MQKMQEMRVRSLDWEDFLGGGLATHSSILARSIPGKEKPGGLQSTGSQSVGHDRSGAARTHTSSTSDLPVLSVRLSGSDTHDRYLSQAANITASVETIRYSLKESPHPRPALPQPLSLDNR